MNAIKTFVIELITLEPLAASSGEGRSLIDNDIIYDKLGLPYIPAKRVRGALRESAQELLDMGLKGAPSIDDVFGKEGSQWTETQGVMIDNFKLKGYDSYKFDVERENVNSAAVVNYFTTTDSQTAIDFNKETAQKSSLRTFRVLKTGLVFTSSISCPENSEDFVRKTLINLNRLGTRRNRGWGKVRLKISDSPENAELNTKSEILETFNSIKITINTAAPVVLGGIQSDESTVSSDTYFRGNIIRGILASQFLGDSDFEAMFNQGKLLFSPAFINGSAPIPLCLHEEKGQEANGRVLNVFSQNAIIPTRSLRGTAVMAGIELQTTGAETFSNFHHNRDNNRTAGRSVDGKIFYYEALSEQQEFTGFIHGDHTFLKKILEKNIVNARVGRSQRTQYGKIDLKFEPIQLSSMELGQGDEVYMVCKGHLVVFNQTGNAVADISFLKNYLPSKVTVSEVKVAQAVEKREGFSAVWKSRNPRVTCFAPGSVFIIKNEGAEKVVLPDFVGEKQQEGYGSVMYYKVDVLTKAEKKVDYVNKSDLNQSNEPQSETDFIKAIKQEEKYRELQMQAIAKSSGNYALSNSIISRLIQLLEEAKDDFNMFQRGLKNMQKEIIEPDGSKSYEHRYATKKLEEAHLWEKLDKSDEYSYQKWITFFRYLRKSKSKRN